jgi:homocysteine S-methyltransferase
MSLLDDPPDPPSVSTDRLGRDVLRHALPLVLDGGLSTELEARGHRLQDALWSARLLVDAPDAVAEVHGAFAAAGADIVTTAGYQLGARSLAATGRDPADAAALTRRSVELARAAVASHLDVGERPVRVAASIGAFGALLADGSEYTGGYGVTVGALVDEHAPRVQHAVEAGADLLACETIPSGTEVAAFAELLAATDVPTWVSLSLGPDGTRTPEGQPLDEACGPLQAVEQVVAVGVNCCPPELVSAALETLAPLGLPAVVYPNVGARWDPEARVWVPRDERAEAPGASLDVPGWVAAGARLLGGCCGTAPGDIAAIRRVVDGLADAEGDVAPDS